MLEVIAKLLAAYLAGTVMGGLVIGRLRGGVDLRGQGSGNVGATNALRTQGSRFALAVLAIDLLKGVFAVTAIPALPWPWDAAPGNARAALPFACGIAVTLGHVYPVWTRFRGGKGAATLAGAWAALLPWAFAWTAGAFVVVLALTGYAGLSTVAGAIAGLLFVTCFGATGVFSPAGAFAVLAVVLLVYTHRGNLHRLWQGRENRFDKAMLLPRLLARLRRDR